MALRFGPVGDPLEYDSRLDVARRRGGLKRNGGNRRFVRVVGDCGGV